MSIEDILEGRRKKNKIDLENRINDACKKNPEICDLNNLIKEKNIERLNIFFDGIDKDEKINSITQEIESLESKYLELIESLGYEKSYFEMSYHCDKCKDEGTIGTKNCECKQKLKIEELYSKSKIENIIKKENFDNFNLNFFRKSRQNDEIISPYENMKKIKKEAILYSNNFSNNSESMYFYGHVGTGKTFLINSIAKAVLDGGHSVIYLTESELVDILIQYKFAYSSDKILHKEKVDAIENVDLLIIDDLGTNNKNETTIGVIFDILNDRMRNNRPVIISSNIEPWDLSIEYNERIYSRITGTYTLRNIYGDDLRMR